MPRSDRPSVFNSLLESTSPRRETWSSACGRVRAGLPRISVRRRGGAGRGDAEAAGWSPGPGARAVVGRGGIDPTPSFFLVRDKLEYCRPRVLTRKDHRPHKAEGFDEIAKDDLDHPIACIGSLERPEGRAPCSAE